MVENRERSRVARKIAEASRRHRHNSLKAVTSADAFFLFADLCGVRMEDFGTGEVHPQQARALRTGLRHRPSVARTATASDLADLQPSSD